jgi:hypothetical protein
MVRQALLGGRSTALGVAESGSEDKSTKARSGSSLSAVTGTTPEALMLRMTISVMRRSYATPSSMRPAPAEEGALLSGRVSHLM